MKYFDTTYLVRLYLRDPGWEAVRSLAASEKIVCSLLGKAEVIAAFHRKFREAQITQKDLTGLIDVFEEETNLGAVTWFPISERILARVMLAYKSMPPTTALRSADAIHLATAAEGNLGEVYTNDRRLLLAAEWFGMKGINVF